MKLTWRCSSPKKGPYSVPDRALEAVYHPEYCTLRPEFIKPKKDDPNAVPEQLTPVTRFKLFSWDNAHNGKRAFVVPSDLCQADQDRLRKDPSSIRVYEPVLEALSSPAEPDARPAQPSRVEARAERHPSSTPSFARSPSFSSLHSTPSRSSRPSREQSVEVEPEKTPVTLTREENKQREADAMEVFKDVKHPFWQAIIDEHGGDRSKASKAQAAYPLSDENGPILSDISGFQSPLRFQLLAGHGKYGDAKPEAPTSRNIRLEEQKVERQRLAKQQEQKKDEEAKKATAAYEARMRELNRPISTVVQEEPPVPSASKTKSSTRKPGKGQQKKVDQQEEVANKAKQISVKRGAPEQPTEDAKVRIQPFPFFLVQPPLPH